MARLTKQIRLETVYNLCKHTFQVRLDALLDLEGPLAFELRDTLFGKHKDAYLALPPNMQQFSNDLTVWTEREITARDALHFHPKASVLPNYVECTNERYRSFYGGLSFNVRGDGEEVSPFKPILEKKEVPAKLLAKIIKHAEAKDKLNEDISKLRVEVETQIKAITTTEKLIKAWPEIAEYLPPSLNPLVVVVQRNKLNKLVACMEAGTCK